MRQYLQLCERILNEGALKDDRTGTGTLSVFGHQMRFDLAEGFPLLTTKDMNEKNEKTGTSRLDGIIEELLWFLAGDTNIKSLVDKGVNIWNRDAYRVYKAHTREHTPMSYKSFVEQIKRSDLMARQWGDLGPVYGKQWRSWGTRDGRVIDQIAGVIHSLTKDPDSRRHIVTAWNPGEINDMALPPCHALFQFYVADGKLSCQLYQRSADVFLGLPFNIASYALLAMMIADQVGLDYGELVHTLGDAHIYLNHVEQVKEQLTRKPYKLPKMHTDIMPTVFDYSKEDFELQGYRSHPPLSGQVSVGD